MKQISTLVFAVVATLLLGQSESQAQVYAGGYQFAAGYGACGHQPFARGFQREQPPYFAKFPPVYYSHIVKRPYGISPFAAPSGIRPVEMDMPEPITVQNPYVDPTAPIVEPAAPLEAPEAVDPEASLKPSDKQKSVWIANFHFGSQHVVGL